MTLKMKTKKQIINRTLHTAHAGIHVREKENGEASRTIIGHAILFNELSEPLWRDEDSEAREIIDPSAITQSLLDNSDIKFTMFHDRQLILARSNKGEGTLSYGIDDDGVYFEFDAPNTADGDKALELVRRGDLAGCSFAFSTSYWDDDFVERTSEYRDGKTYLTYRVKVIKGIYDFTLAADPAYPSTSVEARELIKELREEVVHADEPDTNEALKIREQLAEMRAAAKEKFI